MVKKIGILTSGGDCAGLNAVVRAATLRAVNEYNWQVFGIKDGTLGLLKDPLDVIELKRFKSSIIHRRSTADLKCTCLVTCTTVLRTTHL